MPVSEVNEAVLQMVERHAPTEEAIERVIQLCERDDVTDLQTNIDGTARARAGNRVARDTDRQRRAWPAMIQ